MPPRHNLPILLALVLTILTSAAGAQPPGGRMGGTIEGLVVDSILERPIEYATATLYSRADSSKVTGGVTDADGRFLVPRVRPGVYFMQVSFVGYQPKVIDSVAITREQRQVDVGRIELVQYAVKVGDVSVVGEKPAIEYKIDKKVINVSEMPTAASGTAVDVLENVPSVEVDIEGNVSLRGSSNFTVLIDGRPSILDSDEALQQIPASTIETIELITNPSAKYDPDGSSGIINVLLKKGATLGTSGIFNVNVGRFDNYNTDFLLGQPVGKNTFTLGGRLGKRGFPGGTESEDWTRSGDTTWYTLADGDRDFQMRAAGLRGEARIPFSEHDDFSLGFRYGYRSFERDSRLATEEWSEPGGDHRRFSSVGVSERSGGFFSASSDYRHEFDDDGHELRADASFRYRGGDEESITEEHDGSGGIITGEKTTESGPSKTWRLRVDYTRPLSGERRFEAGYQSRLGVSEDNNATYLLDSLSGEYILDPDFNRKAEYQRDIHSLYATYSGTVGKFGYQAGVREEYTYRNIELIGEDQAFNIDRWDFFPSAHVSWQLPAGQQLMASYTRRIDRVRGWHLEPFITKEDANSVRRGNPGLKPEYIDSYEAGYQRRIGANLFTAEGYYRVTHNKVEHITSVYEENVMLHTIENVGTDYSMGAEFMLRTQPLEWWRLNLMASLFDYRVEGELNGESFDRDSFNWRARVSNSIDVTRSMKLQLDGMYRSASTSAQGDRNAFFMTNLALRKDFLERTLSATLQVRDLFGRANREHTSEGPDFYSYSLRERRSPMISLNLRYNFNNFREDRNRSGENGSSGEMDNPSGDEDF